MSDGLCQVRGPFTVLRERKLTSSTFHMFKSESAVSVALKCIYDYLTEMTLF